MSQKIDLIDVFKNFLKKENLEGRKILLMVSGGVDSIMLLEVAQECVNSENIAVFHLDHNARENSKDDADFVQNICAKKNIKFYRSVLSPFSKEELKSHFSSQNIESSWRNARKTFSETAAQNFNAERILTAHHATDLVETMIFRLVKGCGAGGLSPFDISTKPFWGVPKSEILKYAQKNALIWREDLSNQNLEFERNLIRYKILPELRKITPNLEKVFVNESLVFAEIQDFLDKSFDDLPKMPLSIREFLGFSQILQKEFLRKISKTAVSFSEVEDCLKWLKNNPKGNSQKKIGKTILIVKKNNFFELSVKSVL